MMRHVASPSLLALLAVTDWRCSFYRRGDNQSSLDSASRPGIAPAP